MNVLAIDPGTTESGVVFWDGRKIYLKGKERNQWVLKKIRLGCDFSRVCIEEINPYTMGKTTRDTILWSGRFQEACENRQIECSYLSRIQVRQHLCGSGGPKINDSVITQALVDRFAYGQKNFGKGTKKEPGFFFGFKKDIWQAFAIAVTWHDQNKQ
jgi:hypothetical protein